MKSSSGAYFIGLDHIRALATYLVVTWHFSHSQNGYPIPLNFTPSFFPFAILDEGHTGVALFITLSGYLFAKLLDGKSIDFPAFIWNRILRLVPLLAIVVLIIGVRNFFTGEDHLAYLRAIASSPILPSLPHGGWSITAEFHCYVVLPLLLWMLRKSKYLPLTIVLAAISIRCLIYGINGQVHIISYSTIVGRIDQFTLGILAYQFRDFFAGRHLLLLVVLTAFAGFYWYFDSLGGFYQTEAYPSPSPWWILIPTIEGATYAMAIAWYESSFLWPRKGISGFLGKVGGYSYSIYLLHFFFVYAAAAFVDQHIMKLSNFYVACFWSGIFFLLMTPIGYLSFRYIEEPFLRLRKRYLHPSLGDRRIFWRPPSKKDDSGNRGPSTSMENGNP